jgi:DNA anti-recombination protein RmuC
MNFNDNSDQTEEQSSNQQSGQQSGMRGPEAASRRDVQEAEAKAESAHERATQVHEELRSEIEGLRERVDDLEESHAALLSVLDEQLEQMVETMQTPLGRSFERKDTLENSVESRKAEDRSESA